jgi:hypothetical protein
MGFEVFGQAIYCICMRETKSTASASYELGSTFTWINPSSAAQKGWELNKEARTKISDGTFKYLVLALNADAIKANGVLGGIEIIFNSENTGFCIDYCSFPWYWDVEAKTGGWISYDDLLSNNSTVLDSSVTPGIIYLGYNLTSHPKYNGFKNAMHSEEWGQISVQYGLGIKNLPFVNAYLKANF